MPTQLRQRVDGIKKGLLFLGAMVEEALRDAIRAVEDRAPSVALRVIDGDQRIDAKEVEIERECLATLTLEQPVAFDLRFVVAALKMNGDLERIGDLAANIAEQAELLATQEALPIIPFDLRGMERKAEAMLKQSLDALVHLDADLAEMVRAADHQVDEIYRKSFRLVEAEIRRDPRFVQQHVHLLSVARNLERVADHAVNIAEDVLYLTSGEICRHQGAIEEPRSDRAIG